MNRLFDRCGKCKFFTPNPKADRWSYRGFCDNEAYSKRFRINESSLSCDRGEPIENPDNSQIPDRIPERD